MGCDGRDYRYIRQSLLQSFLCLFLKPCIIFPRPALASTSFSTDDWNQSSSSSLSSSSYSSSNPSYSSSYYEYYDVYYHNYYYYYNYYRPYYYHSHSQSDPGTSTHIDSSSVQPSEWRNIVSSSLWDDTYDPHLIDLRERYPDCTGLLPWIADGWCDDELNTSTCDYDGGDCCSCECASSDTSSDGTCILGGADCIDPIQANSSCNMDSSSSESSASDDLVAGVTEQYPNCTKFAHWIADGYCDWQANGPFCGYDGGDCCPCTCKSTNSHRCGVAGYDCQDPNATSIESFCDDPPLAEVSPCSPNVPKEWEVNDAQDVISLAEGIYCSGGTFEVHWKGDVTVTRTMHIIQGTILHVYGDDSGAAVASGGGISRIFAVRNASLHVSDLLFSEGFAYLGGAIAAESSNLTFRRTEFQNNGASLYGGALYARGDSSVSFNDTTFANNYAHQAGGALFVAEASFASRGEEAMIEPDMRANAGGAMHARGTTSISWSGRTVFSSNRAGTGGALSIWNVEEVNLGGNATFVANIADTARAGAMFLGVGCNVNLSGVVDFIGNVATSEGGVIASVEEGLELDGANTNVSMYGDISFSNNSCGGNGGAILLANGLSIDFQGANLRFSDNHANVSGGAVYASDPGSSPRFEGAIFSGNTAREDGGGVYTAGSVASKADDTAFSNPTVFKRCTFKDNYAEGEGGAIYSASGVDFVFRSYFIGNVASVGGALRLASQAALVHSCSFFENGANEGRGPAIANEGLQFQIQLSTFKGNFFTCPVGEFVDTSQTSTDARYERVCASCPSCSSCDVANGTILPICTRTFEHVTSAGGSIGLHGVIVQNGYWRVTEDSRMALPCYNPEACEGGITRSSEFCNRRYHGPYCALCSEGYASRIAFHCEPCAEQRGGRVIVVVVGVVLGLIGVLLVWYLLSDNAEVAENGFITRAMRHVPIQSLKIIVVVWQIVTQFASAANVTFPKVYEDFLRAVKLLNFELEWILSAACILDVNFHYRFLMITIGPFVALGLLGLTYAIAATRSRTSPRALRRVQDKHISMVLWLTLLVYSSTSSAVFKMFACDVLDDGNGYRESYLRTDYRIDCYSRMHRRLKIFAALMIVVYPVGIPVFYWVLLFRKRKMLQDPGRREENRRLRSISALWNPYTPVRFYYEVIECVRRMWLAGAVAFIYPNTAAQIAITIVIALIFAFLCEGLSPYSSRLDAWVSRTGHAIVFFSMYVALLVKVDVSQERERSQDVFAAVLVAAHCGMVGAIFVEALVLACWASVREELQPRTRSTRTIIDAESEEVQQANELFARRDSSFGNRPSNGSEISHSPPTQRLSKVASMNASGPLPC